MSKLEVLMKLAKLLSDIIDKSKEIPKIRR